MTNRRTYDEWAQIDTQRTLTRAERRQARKALARVTGRETRKLGYQTKGFPTDELSRWILGGWEAGRRLPRPEPERPAPGLLEQIQRVRRMFNRKLSRSTQVYEDNV